MIEPELEILENDDQYVRVSVGPLERGRGVTLGNVLRRTLLGSLPGAAVTWMKIDGLQHEFTTIPYVKEDATEFLLNVKALRLRTFSHRPGVVTLDVKGKKEVCAGEIKTSADFEVVNPDLYLLTLDSRKAALSVEFNVEIGTGFIPANTGKGLPIGVIPVDSIFTPVRRVNHSVESVVAGQYEDMDRLILEVWTDGTITGVEAISEGADILTKQLAIFRDVARMSILEDKKNLLRKVIPSEQYDMPVEQLSLSTRTQNCLRRGGIATVGVLLERSEESLPSLPNFGQKSKEEVIRAMEEMGLIIPTGKTGGKSEPAVRQADGTESNVESDETSNSGS